MSIAGYEYRKDGGSPVDVGNVLTTTVTGLTADTEYDFEIRAYDGAGNRSAWSSVVSATTESVPLPAAVIDINPASLIYADGDSVSSFTDDSGVAWEFVGVAPIFKIVSGVPCLRFNGSTQALKTSATLDLSAETIIDAFLRTDLISDSAGNILYEHGTNLGTDLPSFWGFMSGGGALMVAGHSGTGPAFNAWTTSEAFNVPKLLHCKSDRSLTLGAETVVKVDNVATGGSQTFASETSGNFANKTLYVGARAGTSNFGNFDLYRLRISVGGLTGGEVDQIANELMNPPVPDNLLVVVGDSLATDYLGTTSVPEELAGLLGTDWRVINEAIPGQQVSEVNTNFATQVTANLGGSETRKVVLMRGGINDLDLGASAATVKSRLETFAASVQGAGAEVAICSLTGIGPDHASYPGLETDRLALNALLDADNAFMDIYVDIVSAEPLLDDGDDATYFLADDIHETTAGRELEAATIYGILIP